MGWQYGDYILPAADIPAGFCNAPTNLSRTVNGDTVTFRWDKPHDVLYYQLQITEVGGTQNNFDVYGTIYTRKLNPNTNYTWKVISICSTNPARQSIEVDGPAFTTGAYTSTCPVIDVADCIVVSFPDKVTISWPPVADANFYEVHYKPRDFFGDYTVATVQEAFITIDFLLPNTEYVWNVRPVCSENTPPVSDHDGSFTTPVGEEDCPTPKITSITSTYDVVTVVWEFEPLHKAYNIFLNNILKAQGFIGNIFILKGLEAGTPYTVDVVAVCDLGNSASAKEEITTAQNSCDKPTTLNAEYVDGVGLRITFTPVPEAPSNYVDVNGTRYQVESDAPILELDVPKDGTIYNIEVRALCGYEGFITGTSLPASISYQVPFVCLPVDIQNIIPGPDSIFIDWKSVLGVTHYFVEYKKVSDIIYNGEIVTLSQKHIKNLSPNEDYNIRITTNCQDQTEAIYTNVVSTSVLGSCPLVVVNPVIEITNTSALIRISVVGNPGNGLYLAVATDGVNIIEQEFFDNEVTLTGLLPGVTYTVNVHNQCTEGTTSVSAPVVFTTLRSCVAVSNLHAVANYSTGQIDITWLNTGLVVPYMLDIYRRLSIENYFTLIASDLTGVTTYSYDFITADPLDISEIKVVTRDTLTELTCEASVFIDCPAVTELQSEVTGNQVLLKWKPIIGVDSYRVKLTSLAQSGPEVYTTETPSIHITELDPETLYSWFVETVCIPGVEGPYSDVATFTTEEVVINDEVCSMPQFTAEGEDSEFTNPDTGNPTKKVFYFTQTNNSDPTSLPTFIEHDPLGDITIDYGPIDGSKYYGMAYLQSDNPDAKQKYQDQNDLTVVGDIGGISDLFEIRTVVINGLTYIMVITRYDTTFAGTNKTLKFYTL